MHDYIVYRLMGEFGVAAPLCSYAFVTLNGEDFGLYLAVEAVEDSFLQRNYGPEHGALYKPDATVMRSGGNLDTRLQYIDDDPESYPCRKVPVPTSGKRAAQWGKREACV